MCIDSQVKPILRWAGGKSWLIPRLRGVIPNYVNRYIEPFAGSAALFLDLIKRAHNVSEYYLSDLNKELIDTYTTLRHNPEAVIKCLKNLENTIDCYYKTREQISGDIYETAARFIFLNRTCFNGLYRVNKHNVFNVPYGNKSYRVLFDFDNLRVFSELLKKAYLAHLDFSDTLEFITPTSLVFLDPPYTVAHQNNNFVKYNQKLFSWDDQLRLAEYIQSLKRIGAKFIMTNASHLSTEQLFSGLGTAVQVQRHSVIGSKPQYRKKVEELIITNLHWR